MLSRCSLSHPEGGFESVYLEGDLIIEIGIADLRSRCQPMSKKS